MTISYSDQAASQLGVRPFRSTRLAAIAALADETAARMDDTPPADDAPPADPPADDPPSDPPKGDDDGTDWKAASRKHEDAKKREKAAREKAETDLKAANERTAAILKAAGVGDDEDPAERLKATATERDTAVSERDQEKAARVAAERQNVALRAAFAAGANVETLFDSSAFLRELDGLGDDADEAAVKKLVADTLKAKPHYKAGPPTPATKDGATSGEPKRKPDVTPGMGRMREAYGS